MLKRLTSECVGSFSLVFFGCGSTVIAGGYFCPDMEMVCQAAAFGLASTMLFYVLRPVSGAHFNPAVTVAFAIADRFPIRDLVPYIVAQVAGAIGGAMVLYVVASGRGDVSMNLATLGGERLWRSLTGGISHPFSADCRGAWHVCVCAGQSCSVV
jgi:aquaporin Z